VLSLKGNTNLLTFYSLNPTRKKVIHDLKILNSDVKIWDFGGQEQYRNEFLKNFKNNFSGTSKIIYVIDIQDKDKYDITIEHFEKIINLMGENTTIELSIFLHKFDPDLADTHPEITDEVVRSLKQRIKDIIPSSIFYNIFNTTIYTVFEKTITD